MWDKAEPDFLKALEMVPNHPKILNYLGYSWIDQGLNLEEALKMVEKAAAISPRDGFIIDSLGWGLYRLGRFEEAVEKLEIAAQLEPVDPVINDHLGDAYWMVGRKREARFQWDMALANDPDPDLEKALRAKLENGLNPLSELKQP
jgi:Flp pilus assembly protein TadD